MIKVVKVSSDKAENIAIALYNRFEENNHGDEE